MTDVITTRREGAVLEVTLDRPKANAIDLATSRLMGRTFEAFRDDPELRVAIVRTAGEKFFCAGWDLKAAAAGDAVDGDYGVGGFGVLHVEPRDVSVSLRIPSRPEAKRSIIVNVQLAGSPQLWREYTVELNDPNEWIIELEVRGDPDVLAALTPQSIRAVVLLSAESVGAAFRSLPISLLTRHLSVRPGSRSWCGPGRHGHTWRRNRRSRPAGRGRCPSDSHAAL